LFHQAYAGRIDGFMLPTRFFAATAQLAASRSISGSCSVQIFMISS
jgi:hypothetical protein